MYQKNKIINMEVCISKLSTKVTYHLIGSKRSFWQSMSLFVNNSIAGY